MCRNVFTLYLLCNWKVPLMLKVLHGTINANKEPAFLKVHLTFNILDSIEQSHIVTLDHKTSHKGYIFRKLRFIHHLKAK